MAKYKTMFQTLVHPERMQIIQYLVNKSEVSAFEVSDALNMQQQYVNIHLIILYKAGLLDRKAGLSPSKHKYMWLYSLKRDVVMGLLKENVPKLTRLLEDLEKVRFQFTFL